MKMLLSSRSVIQTCVIVKCSTCLHVIFRQNLGRNLKAKFEFHMYTVHLYFSVITFPLCCDKKIVSCSFATVVAFVTIAVTVAVCFTVVPYTCFVSQCHTVHCNSLRLRARLVQYGPCSFALSGPGMWNTITVTRVVLLAFCRGLKAEEFSRSYSKLSFACWWVSISGGCIQLPLMFCYIVISHGHMWGGWWWPHGSVAVSSGKSGPKDQVALHYYYTSPSHWCTTQEVLKL